MMMMGNFEVVYDEFKIPNMCSRRYFAVLVY